MNEKIQELAKQAMKDTSMSFAERWDRVHRSEFMEVYNEKFAELIVRECVDIVGKVPNGYRDYRNQIEDAMRTDCLQAMQEHFGVE